jgi:hypothetical protein
MGGIVDPKTGQVIWETHVSIEDQLAFYASHPPAALKALRVKAIELPDRAIRIPVGHPRRQRVGGPRAGSLQLDHDPRPGDAGRLTTLFDFECA